MNKILCIVIIIILFSFPLIAQDTVGIALKVKGDVILTHGEDLLNAKNGSELENEDTLESKDESFAVVKFIDGSSVVKLFPNSILTINASKTNGKLNKKSTMKLGELWAKVSKNTGSFIVDTPTTVVSVKGTKFILSVDESGFTDLYTLDGVVNIKNKLDDKEADVKAGQKAHSIGKNEILVAEIEEDEMKDYDVKMSENLKIELKNDNGEKRTITIEFE
ncbi:MAG: FecR family protein [Candidatus Tenebribacter davisii]|jgi:hypothetical protein|nr:FecR family protein [Candidatus Tenebribacter davisii]